MDVGACRWGLCGPVPVSSSAARARYRPPWGVLRRPGVVGPPPVGREKKTRVRARRLGPPATPPADSIGWSSDPGANQQQRKASQDTI